MNIKNETVKEAVKYLFVGGSCTILDFIILLGLVELMNINFLLASILSFVCGVILNYFLCTYWVFHTRIVKKRCFELLFYILISIVGLGINTFFIWGLTSLLGLYFMLSKLFSTVMTYFWNFFARKYILHYKSSLK